MIYKTKRLVHMTKPSYDAQTPFRRERPKLETQATERLYKDAPPGILMDHSVSNLLTSTSPINP